MKRFLRVFIWMLVSVLGAAAYAVLASRRGEPLNAAWMVVAALCTYAIGIRFYSKWIAARVLMLDDLRATPAEVHDDGRDFVRTNKYVLFGHHFASISGPGPLVGPVLAAQFGYLPGTLWILIGVLLGGAVQDFVILFGSVRRDGKSLVEMVRDEVSGFAGTIAMLAVLGILIIIVASLGLVVTNALAESPWGVVTTAMTIPFAMIMGVYVRFLRVGKVLEMTVIGALFLLASLLGGFWVNQHATFALIFTWSKTTLALCLIAYGLSASVLPVWLLLAPRDYLVTFLKIGVVVLLALGILLVLPPIQMPWLTDPARFAGGMRPVVSGGVFPFCFITIACGSVSGFHALVASGTTPKMITRERTVRSIGYGAMCVESFVGIMAMIAACVLDPGLYFAVNAPAGLVGSTPDSVAAAVSAWDFPVTAAQITDLARAIGEKSVLARTGGAPTLAIGMAHIFGKLVGGATAMKLWYHFAIMFEALFILTTLDVATRIGRFLLQELGGRFWKPLGDTKSYPANITASVLFAGAWGYFLYAGVKDPLGGVNSLWPLFGIANQLLACVALCFATTMVIKMGKARHSWVTLLPLAWLGSATFAAALQKIFDSNPRVGFVAMAEKLSADLAAGNVPAAKRVAIEALIFNNYLDAVAAGTFLVLVIAILLVSIREWVLILSGRKVAVLHETAPVWLPAPVTPAEMPRPWWRLGTTVVVLGTLAKELSGEAAAARTNLPADQALTEVLAHRYDGGDGPCRCC
ncbi:MAG: carbon starvation CstA family protein [Polyangia bacterium]